MKAKEIINYIRRQTGHTFNIDLVDVRTAERMINHAETNWKASFGEEERRELITECFYQDTLNTYIEQLQEDINDGFKEDQEVITLFNDVTALYNRLYG